MKEKGVYDRLKFVEQARKLEEERLAKEEEWKRQNEAWIKQHGPIPFEVPKLFFDGQ